VWGFQQQLTLSSLALQSNTQKLDITAQILWKLIKITDLFTNPGRDIKYQSIEFK